MGNEQRRARSATAPFTGEGSRAHEVPGIGHARGGSLKSE
jgi:hypothetical protein